MNNQIQNEFSKQDSNSESNNIPKESESNEPKGQLTIKSENTSFEREIVFPQSVNPSIVYINQVNPMDNFDSPFRFDNNGQLFQQSNLLNEKRSNVAFG